MVISLEIIFFAPIVIFTCPQTNKNELLLNTYYINKFKQNQGFFAKNLKITKFFVKILFTFRYTDDRDGAGNIGCINLKGFSNGRKICTADKKSVFCPPSAE